MEGGKSKSQKGGKQMINRPESDKIICIGTSQGIDVNFYRSAFGRSPTIEIMADTGRVTLAPVQIHELIDLLQEAEAFWLEEGRQING